MGLPTLDEHWPASRVAEGFWARTVRRGGLVLPDGQVDLMYVSGRAPYIAGPDTNAVQANLAPGTTVVGVRLRPGACLAVFGESTASFTDKRIALDELLADSPMGNVPMESVPLGQVTEAIGEDERPSCVARELGRFLTSQAPPDWTPDPLLLAVSEQLRRGTTLGAGNQDIPSLLADHTSMSVRQFRRRFMLTFGYGPKMFERICRLNRFLALADSTGGRRSIAQIAAEVGYYDESHLSRDTSRLAGRTPSQLLAR